MRVAVGLLSWSSPFSTAESNPLQLESPFSQLAPRAVTVCTLGSESVKEQAVEKKDQLGSEQQLCFFLGFLFAFFKSSPNCSQSSSRNYNETNVIPLSAAESLHIHCGSMDSESVLDQKCQVEITLEGLLQLLGKF